MTQMQDDFEFVVIPSTYHISFVIEIHRPVLSFSKGWRAVQLSWCCSVFEGVRHTRIARRSRTGTDYLIEGSLAVRVRHTTHVPKVFRRGIL
jgi:hypothetical protein